ncbi:hypothetical protein OPV22_027338 [Ensete ventricosum]|uniref:Uncharacterized protein n=1 Tax=Ensete ventricosum TaxID=4639 RepID=A0AAV8PXC6_ENSVE|nr:hypothetical protein OPV22_027338 [Ensete ventricosum]
MAISSFLLGGSGETDEPSSHPDADASECSALEGRLFLGGHDPIMAVDKAEESLHIYKFSTYFLNRY